jgi:hypothetical protein
MALTNRNIQTLLKSAGYYTGDIDGSMGKKSIAAVNTVLYNRRSDLSPKYESWPQSRKNVAAAQLVLKYAGFKEVGDIDGFSGMLTEYAFEQWEYKQANGKLPDPWRPDDVEAVPPQPTNWGKQSEINKKFGPAGGKQCTAGIVELPFKLKIAWDLKTEISTFRCHEDVAQSITRVYNKVASAYSAEQIKEIGLDLWGGCYNYREKRGGTTLSTHAYGVAVDIDPIRNQLKWNSTQARLAKSDAAEFWKCWESEGWLSLGKARNFDWMHVQAPGL